MLGDNIWTFQKVVDNVLPWHRLQHCSRSTLDSSIGEKEIFEDLLTETSEKLTEDIYL